MAAAKPRRLEVRFSPGADQAPSTVGTLAEHEHRIYFEYALSWLERGLELSPFSLPARPGLIEHTKREFGPLPGLFDDSLPDGWGLLLMDRHFRATGLDPAVPSPLDRLALLGTRTMGALTYHPSRAKDEVPDTGFDLHELSEQARRVHSGQASEVLPQLLRAGGSPGGARPKVLVGYDPASDAMISGEDDLPEGFEHWIVKFEAAGDGSDTGRSEYAYSSMARRAGLQVPETRIFETAEGDHFFGVRRFDRSAGNQRFHMHTFGNLIQANFRIPSCDYADLLKATHLLTRDRLAVHSIFRQMVFNVAAHNRDDHAKNFAFLLDAATGEWRPSPAYDLCFSRGPGGEHTTTLCGEGRSPTSTHMLELARRFDLDPSACRTVIDEVQQAVGTWRELAEQAGVSERTMATMEEELGM